MERLAEADLHGGEEGAVADVGSVGPAAGDAAFQFAEEPDDGGGGFGLGEGGVPVPDGDVGPEVGIGVGSDTELAEDGGVAFGCERGAEAELHVAGDGVFIPLRVHGDGEELGEWRVLANSPGMWWWPAMVMRVLPLSRTAAAMYCCACAEMVSGPMSPRMMRSNACQSSRVSGRICASTRGFCGEALTGWPKPMRSICPGERRMVWAWSRWSRVQSWAER